MEFLLLYAGLDRTSASRGIVLLYTCPFWVAAGAHFYLPDDRLTRSKSIGLVLAGGILLGEPWPPTLLLGLAGIAGGIYLVNR